MTKETLLYKLTGTDTPRFLTEREQKIVDTCLQLINETEQLHKPNVSGSLPPVQFADELLGDYEMATFENGDLCWVLAGTNQKYTTEQIYKILSGNDR